MNSTVSYHGTFPKVQLWCSKTPIGILFRMYYMNMNVLTLYIMYIIYFPLRVTSPDSCPPPSTFKMAATSLLEIKRRTHNNIIHYIFITHTYFSFQICTYQICTHIIVFIYCVFAFFCTLPICIFVYYSLLSVPCPVTVFLLRCGASVNVTNSSYV